METPKAERELKRWRVHVGTENALVTVTLYSRNEQEAKGKAQALLHKGIETHAVVAIQDKG